ncbi:DNA polymerase epsilon subunit C [Penicillium cataractarum]|uniref:NCT transcriptional regulatory complex subunit A n=1 Tax=Penicillium cataractarum TaxID=2100454 RepID=A0A9W9V5J0_9EURO|nr:DNA polymerase epsilon subunit C [Penicillium cataractarum]KAJ5369713.1 DNA polymerase epsilon subunit C [Penicillium cataractarum]
MTEENYRPRSPDFSSPSHPNSNASINSNSNVTFNPTPYAPQSPVNQRASYDASPFFSSYQRPTSSSRVPQQYVPPFHDFDEMARRSSRLQSADAPVPIPAAPDTMPAIAPLQDEGLQARPGAGIEVKTKFPVARIKRIMQADEDVGKVAQVTPIAVSKALELFMISLVTKAAQEAKERNSKRVTATHLKHAVAKDEVLDFLADIIAKVPDAPAGRKHEDDGSDQNEGRRKRGGRRPKEESD